MPDHKKVKILDTDLHNHPAVQAWCELQSVSVVPERIEVIKGEPPENNQMKKRGVVRLMGRGFKGCSIIAKYCQRSAALIENKIYSEILPILPVSSLNYFGMALEPNREFCWVFIENAGEERFFPDNEDHCMLGARWLAKMHIATTPLEISSNLPYKGPEHYLKRLEVSRVELRQHLAKLPQLAEHVTTLKAIAGQFDLLESHWSYLEAICDCVPGVLVHGDFIPRNLRVRCKPSEIELLPFDWGEAGWGMPGIDSIHVSSAAYWSEIQDFWPYLTREMFRKSLIVGKIFRSIDAVHWQIPSFQYEWVEHPMNNMKIYQNWLTTAIQKMEFENHPGGF
jgi:hypothetical protein